MFKTGWLLQKWFYTPQKKQIARSNGRSKFGPRGDTPFFLWRFRFRAIRFLFNTMPAPTGITYKVLSRVSLF